MVLEGKIVIVTGASSGIGAETCIHFVQAGANVVAVGRNLENLKRTVASCAKANSKRKCLSVQADITRDAQKVIDATIAEFGQIDVLVNNAGILANGSLEDIEIEQFDEIMDTNVRAVLQLTKLALPHLIKSKGNIVNVSSVGGLRSFPKALSYCVSKAALDQFTKCTALDLAPLNVRVNSVNPGVIVTDLQKRGGMNDDTYAAHLERAKTTHALGRVGQVAEVAAAILFLASDGASFITGALLSVDGGKSAMCPR